MINFDDLKEFHMPDELLNKLYDCTGSGAGTEGFILCFNKQDGSPEIIHMAAGETVLLGLQKYLESYLESGFIMGMMPPEDEDGIEGDQDS